MSRKLASALILGGILLVASGCESAQQKEAKRINELNVENCLMKKEETTYCDRVDPKLTSKDVMKQVTEQKGIIKKDLDLKSDLKFCLDQSVLGKCKKIDIAQIDIETQNLVADKIQEINIDKCVKQGLAQHCEEIDLSSTDKETEEAVLASIAAIEKKRQLEAANRELPKLTHVCSDADGRNTMEDQMEACKKLRVQIDNENPAAIEYLNTLIESAKTNDDYESKKALDKLAHYSGLPEAKNALNSIKEKKQKEQAANAKPRKSKQQALREICEAGAEYSRDGYGTQAQIARELAFWALDLYRQSGGAASEGQLRNAATHGYMYENCSKY